ncbi:MAG: nucleoside-diphosphate sugar epimerase/dehydratase [Christensenellales bacterium]|nr:nucleoside-diphosphate sugar epimerase/dehydratase [Christensenellales bacterium]
MKCLRDHMWLRKISLFILDILLITLSVYLSMELRFEMYIPTRHARTMMDALPVIWVAYMGCYALGGVYKIMWRYAGVRDTARLCVLSAIACGLTLAANQFLNLGLFRGVLILIGLIGTIAVGGTRMFWRLCSKDRIPGGLGDAQPVMIVGAGEAGAYAVNICNKNPKKMGRPVLLVDDAPSKQGLRIQNVPVRGKTEDIPKLAARYGIREIIVAIPSLGNGGRMQHILELCNEAHCHTRLLSEPADPASEEGVPFIRELNISDFLSREEIELDTDAIAGYLTGKTVMVTGGGGSIGSEICRQIMRFKPKLLIIFEIYENCAYELEYELRQKYGKNCPVTTLIGSIRDRQRLDEVFEAYHPEVVFHAAAHKHVPLMERSPAEAIKNNVFGTQNLLESASAHGVERLVQLSTDKAVNPTNVMGATKRITEMLIQRYGEKTNMKCMAVRFGNVLGSHGSVIPLMEAQIREGGPVTVTHPDIVRYFMTIPEAAQLVLQAGGIAKSGSIFVLDMGEPVRIMDLAKKLIRAYGYEPDVDMPIKIIGLRPGEKLYEELLMDSERDKMTKTAHKKIFVANVDRVDDAQFEKMMNTLAQVVDKNDERAVEAIAEVVTTYHPWKNGRPETQEKAEKAAV